VAAMGNFVEFFWGIWRLVYGLGNALYSFLTYNFDFFGINIQVWTILGGTGVVFFIVYGIIKG
jgi:hypothetical protein